MDTFRGSSEAYETLLMKKSLFENTYSNKQSIIKKAIIINALIKILIFFDIVVYLLLY